jgi:hypothetical protein
MNTIKVFVLKILNCSLIIFSFINASAQNNISVKGDTLVLNNSAKFWINQEITFGIGTMPDRNYSYIYEAPNNLQKLISSHKKKLLTSGFEGFKARIVKFEKEIGHNKKDYSYDVLVLETPNGNRYWCNVANAYASNEIVIKSAPQVAKATPAKKTSDTQSNTSKKGKTSKPKPISVF